MVRIHEKECLKWETSGKLYHLSEQTSKMFNNKSEEIVYENVPISRQSLHWNLMRTFRNGNATSLILNIQLPIIQDDSCILGDVNCDDQINIIDIVTIVQFMFDQIDLNESQFISSDLNLDQTINITDIILIISFILE